MTPERDIRDSESSKWPKNTGGIHRGGFGTNNGHEQNGARKPKIVDERNKNEIENNTAKSWNDNGANVSSQISSICVTKGFSLKHYSRFGTPQIQTIQLIKVGSTLGPVMIIK